MTSIMGLFDKIEILNNELKAAVQDEKTEYEMDQALQAKFHEENPMVIEDNFENQYEAWLERMAEEHGTEGIGELYQKIFG